MIATFALLVLAVEVDFAVPRAMDWQIVRNRSASVATGDVGYLSRDTGKIWVEFQSTGTGELIATVGAHHCEHQRDLDIGHGGKRKPARDMTSGLTRSAKVQARLSILLSEVARVCRVARPTDQIFFRGFRRAFIAFEHTDI